MSALEALADNWSRFLGAIRLAGQVSHPLPGFSSSPLSHPDIVSDAPGRISSITGLAPGGREDVQGCLGNRPRSGSRLLQSSFPSGKGDRGLASRDRPLTCTSLFCKLRSRWRQWPSVLLSIREGDFLASIDLKDVYFQIPVHQSSRKLLRVPVGRDSLSVEGPVLRTVDCPSGHHQGVCSRVCVGALSRDSSSSVPGRLAGPRLFGGGGQ